MIVVREVFQLHFGKAREAIALMHEMIRLEREAGGQVARVLTDMTGPYYTLVMEVEYDSLGEFEQQLRDGLQHPEWRATYSRFVPLVREGRREIYQVVPAAAAAAAPEQARGREAVQV